MFINEVHLSLKAIFGYEVKCKPPQRHLFVANNLRAHNWRPAMGALFMTLLHNSMSLNRCKNVERFRKGQIMSSKVVHLGSMKKSYTKGERPLIFRRCIFSAPKTITSTFKTKGVWTFFTLTYEKAPRKLDSCEKKTLPPASLCTKYHKKCCQHQKLDKFLHISLTPVLCCSPSLVDASCPHRKQQHQEEILPGTRKRGWNQGCWGTSTCRQSYQPLGKQTGLISDCTCGKEK